MNFEQLIQSLDADVYQRLKTAVELGKWPNGQRLSAEQKELTLQAVIAYETQHLPPEQRTGYIDPGEIARKKASVCGHDDRESEETEEETPLRWE